ncbi:MAG TPA: DNA ligase D [Stellaceae bacterium]|nr:DNA ligase D [Stellaceae bacterium]
MSEGLGMGLEEYRRKRDFARTPEPSGAGKKRAGDRPLYVIQKHAARRTHYDFRLEMDGVLRSWAVPKGPSLDPAEKRLAVEVEDHPVEYGGFEGVIPKGEYGGGTVMLWDRGWWEPVGDPAAAFAKGDFKFVLHGEKLRGRFVLVRMKRREQDKSDNWLLIKERDAAARPGSGEAVVNDELLSVASGRDMAAIAKDADRVWRSGQGEVTAPGKAKKRAPPIDPAGIAGAQRAKTMPEFTPQLATQAAHAPPGEDWLHEIKFNGYRILAAIRRGAAKLVSRNGLDWTAKFPELAQALAELPVKDAVLDGEVVHIAKSGATSFAGLQDDLSAGRTAGLVYMAFDLLFLDGWDLSGSKLIDRKAALQALLAKGGAPQLRYSDYHRGRGPEFFASACSFGLEGIVSKRADARYRPGRGTQWLKIKCVNSEEFVVVGFTDPEGARSGFGALLVAYYTPKGKLVYAGRIGTGFSDKVLTGLRARLETLAQKKPTVSLPEGLSPRGVHWVKPELVAAVSFAEWTGDDILRHATFLGLREDKPARDIVVVPGNRADAVAAAPRPSAEIGRDGAALVDGLRVTHADREVYPALGISKLAVAEYYAAVADRMLPHVAERPLSLLRCPDGIAGQCFFQKHLASGGYRGIKQVEIRGKDGREPHVMIEDKDGLIALVQMGALEIHPWGSTIANVEKPDRLIFDLDPDEGLGWDQVVAGALAVRRALEELRLVSFVKTTGGKGLHVVVPIKPTLRWDAAKEFTRAVVTGLAAAAPERYTDTVAKRARRGRIFIDYLRNGRGATAVAAYSTRARPNAGISAPLTWQEVENGVRSDQFTILNIAQRLQSQRADPWADFFTTKQSISAAALRKLRL